MGNLATGKTVRYFCLDWVRPIELEAQETGHEVQLHIEDQQITLQLRVTAIRNN